MSSNFDLAVAADAAAILSVDGEFSELVKVRPRGKAWREVYAIVDRNPPQFIGGDSMVKKIDAVMSFQNHATDGILITEVREGCEVRFNTRKGDDDTRKDALVKLASDPNPVDAGMIRCEV